MFSATHFSFSNRSNSGPALETQCQHRIRPQSTVEFESYFVSFVQLICIPISRLKLHAAQCMIPSHSSAIMRSVSRVATGSCTTWHVLRRTKRSTAATDGQQFSSFGRRWRSKCLTTRIHPLNCFLSTACLKQTSSWHIWTVSPAKTGWKYLIRFENRNRCSNCQTTQANWYSHLKTQHISSLPPIGNTSVC